MSDAAFARDAAAALATLDEETLARIVSSLLEREWIVTPMNPGGRLAPGELDFMAWRRGAPETRFGGLIDHAGDSTPARSAGRIRRTLTRTRRARKARGTHPGRLMLVTSAEIAPLTLQAIQTLPARDARAGEDLVIYDRHWMIGELMQEEGSEARDMLLG